MSIRRCLITTATTVLVGALSAAPVWGATNSAYISVSTHPQGIYDAPGAPPSTTTGGFGGDFSGGNYRGVSTRTEQVRGGVIIKSSSASPLFGSFGPGEGPQAGDVFRVVRVSDSAVLAQAAFDGLPTLDPTTCTGSTALSGLRSADAEVSVRTYGPLTGRPTRYGTSYSTPFRQRGRIAALGAGTFSGSFATPLGTDDLLQVSQSVLTTANDTDVTFSAETTRTVAACPPPAPPVRDTTAAKLLSFQFGATRTSVKTFLKYGIASFIGVDSAGTIVQRLYLDDGAKVPATAAAKAKPKKKTSKKKAKKKPVLIGRVAAKVAAPGVVRLVLKPSKAGKKALKRKRTAKVVLITTVRDAAGNVTRVAPRKFKLVAE